MTDKNIMFLIADDWSPMARCYGNYIVQTPRIDDFANRSVVFDSAFCTSPSCAVSRACILSGYHSHTHGQYGHCHGIQGFSTHNWITSTPQALGAAGYATACIGKKHVEPASVYPFDYEPKVNPRSTADMADCARTFLQENRERPFYLHVGFIDTHRAPGGFGNEKQYRTVPDIIYSPDDVIVPPFLPDLPEVRADLADYYQAVSRFDHGVGLLLDVLEESGRADETLVILTTDHAMPFPGAKASFFDSGHRCPLIAYQPGLKEGGMHNQALVAHTDIRPTIHEWCGLSAPDDLPGRSWLSILERAEPDGWDEVYFSHCFHEVVDYNPYRVLRGRRYKYVQNLAYGHVAPLPTDLYRSPTWSAVRETGTSHMGARGTHHMRQRAPQELYDLAVDPTESTNRIDDPALQTVAQKMRSKLYAFRAETHDPWLEIDFQSGWMGEDPENEYSFSKNIKR
ncbi:sulfatase [Chloroflexi bacterium TSY]|nr:sulfatase [Chloroflexi bacterium TSY]